MTQDGFPLLDEFGIPEGGVCGLFTKAAMELMQTDDPKRPVGQENMEQQELTVQTSDAAPITHAMRESDANAGGGLESNDVVAPDGLPTKAEDEQGGQDMQNRENVLSMQFPDFNDLPENERFSARLAVMTDSDIAETPTDVLFDALDTIDNRRSDAEPTLEQKGYKTKILEELKNRGVEYKKASVDESVYQGFLDAMRNTGASSMQEEFDVMAREMGLGGMQINEIAERLTTDGFEVVAGRRYKKAEPDDDPGDYVFPATLHGSVEEAYQAFMDKQQGASPEEAQENFDVAAREVGLGGQEIYQLEKRLFDEGFEVQAGRRPFPKGRRRAVKRAGIQVFDNGGTTADRYTVIIDGSLYTMSENAMQANGVNMYAGETSEGLGPETGDQEVSVDELPDEVKRAIEMRKQGSIRMAAMTPAEMQEEIVYIAGMLENGGTPEVSLNNIPSYLRVQMVNADKLNATVLSRALEQVAQGLDNGGTIEQAYEDFKEWMGMSDTEGEQPTFGSKRTARFTVSPPYHGESGSLWYIVDENADPVDSAHSKEEAEALKEQYESGEKS